MRTGNAKVIIYRNNSKALHKMKKTFLRYKTDNTLQTYTVSAVFIHTVPVGFRFTYLKVH